MSSARWVEASGWCSVLGSPTVSDTHQVKHARGNLGRREHFNRSPPLLENGLMGCGPSKPAAQPSSNRGKMLQRTSGCAGHQQGQFVLRLEVYRVLPWKGAKMEWNEMKCWLSIPRVNVIMMTVFFPPKSDPKHKRMSLCPPMMSSCDPPLSLNSPGQPPTGRKTTWQEDYVLQCTYGEQVGKYFEVFLFVYFYLLALFWRTGLETRKECHKCFQHEGMIFYR